MDDPNKLTEQAYDEPQAEAPRDDAPPAPVESTDPDGAHGPAPIDEPAGDPADGAAMPPSPAPAEEADAPVPAEPEAPAGPEMPPARLDAQPPVQPEPEAPQAEEPQAAEPAEMPSEPDRLAEQIVADSQGERVDEPSAAEQQGDPKPGTPPEAPVELPSEPAAEAPSEEQQQAPAKKAKAATKNKANAAEPEAAEEAPAEREPKSENMDWYILKVQSNREDSIREALRRRVKIAGLDYFFGDIVIPTEKVTELKGGKKRIVKRKLYPGYLVAHMEINDDTWFLVRETPGIGDFTGAAGKPTPMLPHEVEGILAKSEEKQEEQPKLQIGFTAGDRVKINEGTFENFEGDVEGVDEASGQVTVIINIFGRSTPVTLGYWQIEKL